MTMVDKLAGSKILAVGHSVVNGELTVVKDLAWGTHILAEGLTQSGGIAELIWKSTFKKINAKKKNAKSVLILGLGGGGIAKLVRKHWPKVKMVGVDIDPVIVNLGRKYMKLDKYGVEIVIADAFDFVGAKSKAPNYAKATLGRQRAKKQTKPTTTHQPQPTTYDLICVDMYVGDEYPKKFESQDFIEGVKKLVAADGVAIFNRLYYGEKRKEAVKFGNVLEKIFSKVEVVYPEANVMFLTKS